MSQRKIIQNDNIIFIIKIQPGKRPHFAIQERDRGSIDSIYCPTPIGRWHSDSTKTAEGKLFLNR